MEELDKDQLAMPPKRLEIGRGGGGEPRVHCCRHRTAVNSTPPAMEELDKDQLAMLKKAFDGFDHEKKGAINTDVVATILRMMGQAYNAQTLKELIDEVDEDKSGMLEFEEFVTLAAKFIIEEDAEAMAKELKDAFRLYDKAGNGFIPTSSLKEILKELDDTLSPEDLDNIIGEIDTDGSGTVDFDEFMEMMTG